MTEADWKRAETIVLHAARLIGACVIFTKHGTTIEGAVQAARLINGEINLTALKGEQV